MNIISYFDSGILQPYQIEEAAVTFDLRKGGILNVVMEEVPEALTVILLVEGMDICFLRGQGLVIGGDDNTFIAVPLEEKGDGTFTAVLRNNPRRIRIATRYPYGRDFLDRLFIDTCKTPYMNLRMMRKDYRTVPVFEFGEDDGTKTVHYILAGEDIWETAGTWATDGMIRFLCSDRNFAEEALKDCVIRIVPLLSTFDAAFGKSASYTSLEGRDTYGAATWGDDVPQPEFAAVRDEIIRLITERRLGIFLTIHSWQSQEDFSGLEAIRTSEDKELTGERYNWTKNVLERLIHLVPRTRCFLSEKIWRKGLARDYLLGQYNFTSFRIEITTAGQGIDGFQESGIRLLQNICSIKEFGYLYGE